MKHQIEVFFNEQDLQRKVQALAKQINQDYQDTNNLLLIGLLKGSVIFMSDLCRCLDGHVEIDFMSVSSYRKTMTSSRDVKILKDIDVDIEGRDVLIVEDIIDSGNTLNKVKEMLMLREPKSLKICTLFDKPDRREVEVKVDYIGFSIPDEFIVGYGIDYAEMYRNLPYVAKVIPSEEQ